MPWGIAAAVAGSVVSSALAPDSSGTGAGSAANAADPFASQRPQYQTMLSDMMKPGAAFNATDPSYSARFNEGLRSLESSTAAGGGYGSGAEKAAITQYGQNQASTEWANQFSRLSQLAGANVGSPAAAGQIIAQGNQQQQGGATAIGSAVGAAINNWHGGSNPSGMSGSNTDSIMYGSGSYSSGGGNMSGGSTATPDVSYYTPVDTSSWSNGSSLVSGWGG